MKNYNSANLSYSESSDPESLPDSEHIKMAKKSLSRELIPGQPSFQVYTDSELRSLEGAAEMSDVMKNRLCQSTIANMISSTQNLKVPRYPSFQEVETVSIHLTKIYPALLKNDSHVCIHLILIFSTLI